MRQNIKVINQKSFTAEILACVLLSNQLRGKMRRYNCCIASNPLGPLRDISASVLLCCGARVHSWHKADIPTRLNQCPLSGAKRTLRGRAEGAGAGAMSTGATILLAAGASTT